MLGGRTLPDSFDSRLMSRSGHSQNSIISLAYPFSRAAIKVSIRSLLNDPNIDFMLLSLFKRLIINPYGL